MIIQKLTRTKYKGKVYNIGVQDNHNYYVGNCLVHNCYTDAKKTGKFYDNIVEKAKFFFGNMSENDKPYQIAIGKK